MQEGTLYEYMYNHVVGTWVRWEDGTPSEMPVPTTPFQEILIPTVDTKQLAWMLPHLLSHGTHVLLAGATTLFSHFGKVSRR